MIIKDIIDFIVYYSLYWLFYRFSGAHTKSTSDARHDPTIAHQKSASYRHLRAYEDAALRHARWSSNAQRASMTLPELAHDNISQAAFSVASNGKRTPCVIRGLIRDVKAVTTWSPQYFQTNYADAKVLALKRGEHFQQQHAYSSFTQKMDCDYITIGEGISAMTDTSTESKYYINNVTEIFTAHPELIDDLQLDAIKAIDDSIDSDKWLKVNMFMGGPGTGSSLHCAVGGNFFFNVYGKKRWILIHPKYTKYLRSTPAAGYAFVISSYDLENEDDRAFIDKLPKYEVLLNPGDVLYVPPWWWHYVKNETDFTIGCAVRDHTVYWQSLANNPMFMLMSPYIISLNPAVLWLIEKIKGRKFMLSKSMKSDRGIMEHLAGTTAVSSSTTTTH